MLTAMERHFPPQVKWSYPAGRLFLWVTPAGLSRPALLTEAVAFATCLLCFPSGRRRPQYLRLNFSFCNPEKDQRGLAIGRKSLARPSSGMRG